MTQLQLRVLAGPQRGAKASMRHQRMLVGNLATECDVVLDVGRPEAHACLLRVSQDEWTVLAVTGALWAGATRVPPQQTARIAAGEVLRLGEVAFCVASSSLDWRQVPVPALPIAARRPEPKAMNRWLRWRQQLGQRLGLAAVSATGRLSARPKPGRRWLAAGTLASALSLLAAGTWLMSASVASPRPTRQADQAVATARAVLAEFAWTNELAARLDPASGRVVVTGWLPRHDQAPALAAAFRQRGVAPELRWTAVDEVADELDQRLTAAVRATEGSGVGTASVRHATGGRFIVDAPMPANGAVVPLDQSIRRAMAALPSIEAIDWRVAGTTGTGAVVHYTRGDDAASGIQVAGLDALRPVARQQTHGIREIRMGPLPSVVLDDGARYFEGATLPGQARLLRIRPDHLLTSSGGETTRIDR